jgi:large subunit ribosomal protein L21
MYAVIRSGGKQYRVAPGDKIQVETLPGSVGDVVEFTEVVAVRTDEEKMLTGKAAANAVVSGKIVAQGRGPKVHVLKFKKTNQYKIMRGHRQNHTAVEVGEIKL